eukprot:Pgem_evm1s3585
MAVTVSDSTQVIIGAAVGGFVVLIFLICLIDYILRRRRRIKKKKRLQKEKENDPFCGLTPEQFVQEGFGNITICSDAEYENSIAKQANKEPQSTNLSDEKAKVNHLPQTHPTGNINMVEVGVEQLDENLTDSLQKQITNKSVVGHYENPDNELKEEPVNTTKDTTDDFYQLDFENKRGGNEYFEIGKLRNENGESLLNVNAHEYENEFSISTSFSKPILIDQQKIQQDDHNTIQNQQNQQTVYIQNQQILLAKRKLELLQQQQLMEIEKQRLELEKDRLELEKKKQELTEKRNKTDLE